MSSWTERLRKRLEWEDKKERFLLRPFHSRFYHKYFEGYTEYKRLDKKGKMKITRVYTGQYYRQDMSTKQKVLYRLTYLALYVIALIGFFSGTMQDIPENYNIYINLITAVTVPFLFWVALALVNYLFIEGDMKISDYKSGPVRLKNATLGSFVMCVLRLLSLLLFCAIARDGVDEGSLVAIGASLLAGICAILMNRLERKVPYLPIENQVTPERDGVEIH